MARPKSRVKRITGTGKKVSRRGAGIGGGKVGRRK